MTEDIQATSTSMSLDEGTITINIVVKNPNSRTVYAYGSTRRVFYDNATGKLRLYLHDQHLSPEEEQLLSPHLKQPRFVPLEGKADTNITLQLPLIYHRIRSASERGGGPMIENLRISETKELEVQIGYGETPFYYDPKKSNARQLKEWGNKVVTARFKVQLADPAQGKRE